MSKPILFDIKNRKLIKSSSFNLEKQLQQLVEKSMEEIFGIKFLATEYSFDNGDSTGRIDSLGIDSDNRPVIIEYKLSKDSNVINQSLYYINWLKKHKDSFELLVLEKLGKESRELIDLYSEPRVICIAEQFNKYDSGAVQQMNANIELYQYYLYGEKNDIIGFERVNQINETKNKRLQTQTVEISGTKNYDYELFSNIYDSLSNEMKLLYNEVKERVLGFSDEISYSELSQYSSFKRTKSFLTIVLQKSKLKLYLSIDYRKEFDTYKNVEDVSNKGHWGVGNVLIKISTLEQFEKTFHLIENSFNEN